MKLAEIIRSLFERDLKKLKEEITAYKQEDTIWKVKDGISNSAGNLCLHIIGNLNWFIGNQIGNTGYIRKRDQEFSLRDIPRDQLLKEIDNTREIVKGILTHVTNEELNLDYPIEVFGKKMSTYYFLVHLTTHLAYHLGQINYHRRLLEN